MSEADHYLAAVRRVGDGPDTVVSPLVRAINAQAVVGRHTLDRGRHELSHRLHRQVAELVALAVRTSGVREQRIQVPRLGIVEDVAVCINDINSRNVLQHQAKSHPLPLHKTWCQNVPKSSWKNSSNVYLKNAPTVTLGTSLWECFYYYWKHHGQFILCVLYTEMQ